MAVYRRTYQPYQGSLTAHWRGAEALQSVHDTAGWSVLAFTAAGVAALAWWVERSEKGRARKPQVQAAPKS